ncbi:MAG TPA: DUF4920 domain-containing protein [Thermoanaerobaculia bacterium]|nr:DUF4920 domain-containing protein [Thermoanaerobaculia bacterium]
MRSVLICFLAGLCLAAGARAEACAGTVYGEGVRLAETTPAAAILDRPEEFAGQTVRIEGTVVEVCQKMGCWVAISAGEEGRELRVKVEDGVIVFPASARGKRAMAEGAVETRELSREEWIARLEHQAEEQNRPYDPAAVGDGPFRQTRVMGTGAVICD